MVFSMAEGRDTIISRLTKKIGGVTLLWINLRSLSEMLLASLQEASGYTESMLFPKDSSSSTSQMVPKLFLVKLISSTITAKTNILPLIWEMRVFLRS